MTLSDRERFILHSMSIMSVDGFVKQLKDDSKVLAKLNPMSEKEVEVAVEDIRVGRCRGLDHEQVLSLYEEMQEEMLLGSEIHRESLERENAGTRIS